ncbi:unnamed protein product [Polarella glacialis]|uniref:RING-CH-type domain-containing protein n=1 Tax=Polarella glacialis TaxID=89957 RepID=A0A813FFE1_POLGL|nr:unnamed protein product [Polarella glacialis]
MATEGCRRAVTSSFSHSFSRLFLGPWLLLLSPSWEGSQGGLQLAAAKLVGGPVRLSGPRQEYHWRYLSKFGYDMGTGSYSVRLQLHQPKTIAAEAPVQIEIYLDEVWPAVEAEKDVCARKALAKQGGYDLIIPCRCAGTSKWWLHRSCLDRWRVANRDLKGFTKEFTQCGVCHFDYVLTLDWTQSESRERSRADLRFCFC